MSPGPTESENSATWQARARTTPGALGSLPLIHTATMTGRSVGPAPYGAGPLRCHALTPVR